MLIPVAVLAYGSSVLQLFSILGPGEALVVVVALLLLHYHCSHLFSSSSFSCPFYRSSSICSCSPCHQTYPCVFVSFLIWNSRAAPQYFRLSSHVWTFFFLSQMSRP